MVGLNRWISGPASGWDNNKDCGWPGNDKNSSVIVYCYSVVAGVYSGGRGPGGALVSRRKAGTPKTVVTCLCVHGRVRHNLECHQSSLKAVNERGR